MKTPLRWLLLLIGLVTAVLLARSRFAPRPVTVSAVVRGKAVDAVYATGTVEALERVLVKAKTSGTLLEILVKDGAAVKKGDLLARIDNPVVAFELQRGRADLSAAKAQGGSAAPQLAALRGQLQATEAELGNARDELARVARLHEQGSVSRAELDRARSRASQLEGLRAANEAQQRSLQIDLSANESRQHATVESLASRAADAEVRSPIEGVILAHAVDLGEVVAAGQPLFKVGDIRHLVLELSVDEADIARVSEGKAGPKPSPAAISLYAFPSQIFGGHVFEIAPDANRERKSFLVKVEFDDRPETVRSGMSGEVNLIAGERDGALLAPTESIADGAAWVVRDGRAHLLPVTTGYRDLIRTEILTGLAEEDRVVVGGQERLKQGDRVEPTARELQKNQPVPDTKAPGQTSL